MFFGFQFLQNYTGQNFNEINQMVIKINQQNIKHEINLLVLAHSGKSLWQVQPANLPPATNKSVSIIGWSGEHPWMQQQLAK